MVYMHRTKDGDLIVAEPDRSATWETNKIVLLIMCALSGTIALGFTWVGAWPILPFAGLEMMGLGSALYYVCWKLRYRHVITLAPGVVRIQKGHYYPRKEWELAINDVALSILPERHPLDAPSIILYGDGEEIPLGEVLGREDAIELSARLKARLPVVNDQAHTQHDF